MQELHAGALEGHLDEEKTLNKIKEEFYHPGMHHVVEACQCNLTDMER